MQRIGTALEIIRYREFDRRLPARIIEIIAVEMDGAIVFGLPRPAMLLAGPVPALHAAGRQMHDPAVMLRGAGIDGSRRADVPGEIPSGNDVFQERGIDDGTPIAILPVSGMDAREKQGTVDLAVEMAADCSIGLGTAGHQQRCGNRLWRNREPGAGMSAVSDPGIGLHRT